MRIGREGFGKYNGGKKMKNKNEEKEGEPEPIIGEEREGEKPTLKVYADFVCPQCQGNFGKRLKVYYKRGRRGKPNRIVIEEVQEVFCPQCKTFHKVETFDIS